MLIFFHGGYGGKNLGQTASARRKQARGVFPFWGKVLCFMPENFQKFRDNGAI